MGWWRAAVGLLLVTLVGPPLLAPLVDLATTPSAWQAWGEGGRLLELAGNTLLLGAGTLLLALPAGLTLAVLLFRTDLPGRAFLRFLLVVCLFIPLPLLVSGWRGCLA